MLIVIGVNSLEDVDSILFGGVFGSLLLLEESLLHLFEAFELTLLLFVTFNSADNFAGDSGVFCIFTAGELTLDERCDAFSSTVLTEPSRALEEVVGASPESLFQPSSSLRSSVVRRSAGCVSVGGACGGATVMGIGGVAGTVSS